jgi:hypothetical protein
MLLSLLLPQKGDDLEEGVTSEGTLASGLAGPFYSPTPGSGSCTGGGPPHHETSAARALWVPGPEPWLSSGLVLMWVVSSLLCLLRGNGGCKDK